MDWENFMKQRKQGLRGKPHLPYGHVERIIHESNKVKNEKRIQVLHSRHTLYGLNENRDMVHSILPWKQNRKHNTNNLIKPIQQPRKQN